MQDYLSVYKIRIGVGTGSGKANMKQKNGINIPFEVLDALQIFNRYNFYLNCKIVHFLVIKTWLSIPIRIDQKAWIRIWNQLIQIHNTSIYPEDETNYFF